MARVLLFGRLRDIAGWSERALPADTLDALTAALAAQAPDLGEALRAKGVRVAVNLEMVRGEVLLRPDDEVAFMPPMSGG